MRFLPLVLALLLPALPVRAGDGQGPVKPGPIEIQDFNMGTYWFGAKITNKDLLGKVVLIETWGS
ncbi:MAG: hypothetical protein ACYTGZ_10755 [Planctomycetota bacterium]|jgi:hypothetical protein